MPAQVPSIGAPPRAMARIGSRRPYASISRRIVVDSPPGRISASSPSRSAGSRTSTGSAADVADGLDVLADGALQRQHADPGGGASAAGSARGRRRLRHRSACATSRERPGAPRPGSR